MYYALLLKPFAILALIVGAITLPTPLPTGAPLIALGLAILVATSSTVRGWMRTLRRRSGRVDTLVKRVEPHVGRRLGVALRRTRPVPPPDASRVSPQVSPPGPPLPPSAPLSD